MDRREDIGKSLCVFFILTAMTPPTGCVRYCVHKINKICVALIATVWISIRGRIGRGMTILAGEGAIGDPSQTLITSPDEIRVRAISGIKDIHTIDGRMETGRCIVSRILLSRLTVGASRYEQTCKQECNDRSRPGGRFS